MDKTSGIKVIRISTDEEVDYIFTDMGDVKAYPDGEFYTSKLEVDGKAYYSRTSRPEALYSSNLSEFRYKTDLFNFAAHGFRLVEL